MELLYSMRRKPLKFQPPHYERASDSDIVRPICTISCGNIVAFSSRTELSDTDCDTWGGHVYVCDLDTPWDSHKVVSTTHAVSALEWDGEGKQLLVATTEGKVSVFGQKDYLINEWTLLYSTTFPGEHIIRATFFHNGRRFMMTDKKPDALIPEKVQALRYAPTLKGFGGVASPGVLVVSTTGLVGVAVPTGPAGGAGGCASHSDSLRAHRDRLVCADIAHTNGTMLIAAACVSPGGGGAVRVARAVVAARRPRPLRPAPPHLAIAALPSILCTHTPVSIAWCLGEEGDSLLVGGQTLALWSLTERQHVVHKLLAKGGATEPHTTPVWQQTMSWPIEGGGTGVVRVTGARGPAGATGAFAVLSHNRSVHLLGKDSHHYVRSVVVCGGGEAGAGGPDAKKAKYAHDPRANNESMGGAVVSCAQVTALGGVLLAVDTRAQLHAYKLLLNEPPSPSNIQLATNLLEYSMVTGYDCLDVLYALSSRAEAVYERFTNSFQHQPAAFQQYYYHSWLKIRIALCRLIPTATSSVSWLTCLQTLWGLWHMVSGAHRPDDVTAHIDDLDNEKALLALEAKVDMWCESSVLTALRRPLVRALDIAATALAAAADTGPSLRHHGYELWADPVGISLLRKLAVFARGAGLGDPALARLLARLHQPAKPELIEECAAVASAWGGRIWEVHPRIAVSTPATCKPLYLDYGVEPTHLRWAPSPPAPANSDLAPSPAPAMDCIRYMYLGMCGRWRGCARCGGRALPPRAQRHPAQRAHDAAFLTRCRCGGRWTLVSSY